MQQFTSSAELRRGLHQQTSYAVQCSSHQSNMMQCMQQPDSKNCMASIAALWCSLITNCDALQYHAIQSPSWHVVCTLYSVQCKVPKRTVQLQLNANVSWECKEGRKGSALMRDLSWNCQKHHRTHRRHHHQWWFIILMSCVPKSSKISF